MKAQEWLGVIMRKIATDYQANLGSLIPLNMCSDLEAPTVKRTLDHILCKA